MVKIRMQRIGRRHEPHYRVVVIDGRRGPKSGRFIEIIGHYNAKMGGFSIDKERASYWLSVGAQPSGTVHNFLVDQGVIEAPKKNVLPKKTPIKKEVEEGASEEKAPAPKESAAEPAPAEEAGEDAPAEEAPAEEAKEEAKTEEAPAESEENTETKEEAPAEQAEESTEEPAESTEEAPAESEE